MSSNPNRSKRYPDEFKINTIKLIDQGKGSTHDNVVLQENTPTLQTQRLILRKFEESDAPAILSLLSDIEVNTFLPWFPLKSIEEAKTFLKEHYLDYYEKSSSYRYAICKKEDNIPIGYVALASNDSNDFGYGLKKEFWHTGILTEATLTVVAQIKNAGYPYITATHDKNNPHSGAVMKKLGMEYKYSYVEQ